MGETKQMESENGTVAEDRKNVVVRKVGLSVSEKQRIEKLIDSRVQGLCSYLDELSAMSSELSGNIPFTKQTVKDQAEIQLTTIQSELDKIRNAESAELVAQKKVLEIEHEAAIQTITIEIARLESEVKLQQEKMKVVIKKYEIDIAAITSEVAKKFKRKDDDLEKRRAELNKQIDELTRLAKIESSLSSAVFVQQINTIRSGVTDTRNKAVEKLWTECDSTEDAQTALNLIPDSVTLRSKLTSEMICDHLNDTISKLALPTTALMCRNCNRNTITIDRNSYCRCTACGAAYYYDDEARKITKKLALPSFDDLVNKVR